MTRIELRPGERGTPQVHVRVVGALRGKVLRELLEQLGDLAISLDLSQVREADYRGVHLLAHLAPGSCELVGCADWLSAWVEGERRPAGSAAVNSPRDHGGEWESEPHPGAPARHRACDAFPSP